MPPFVRVIVKPGPTVPFSVGGAPFATGATTARTPARAVSTTIFMATPSVDSGVPPEVRSTPRTGLPNELGDAERALHRGGVRVADVRVLACLQRERPRRVRHRADARRLLDAGADQVEVVDRGLVADADHVDAVRDRR